MRRPDPSGYYRRRRKEPATPTEVVTGLRISRGNTGWHTRWTATYRGEVIGTWSAKGSSVGTHVLDVEGRRLPGSYLYLRDWRRAVVAEARAREARL